LRARRSAGEQAALRMVYSHLKYSDKAFMGSVTAPSALLTRSPWRTSCSAGAHRPCDRPPKTTIINLINVNSPMTTMRLCSRRPRSTRAQSSARFITPFILAGAMSPVTVAAPSRKTLAEALLGGLRAARESRGPGRARSFASSFHAVGRSHFGTPEPALVLYCMAALAPPLGIPFRSEAAFAHRRSRMRRRHSSQRTRCCRPASPA